MVLQVFFRHAMRPLRYGLELVRASSEKWVNDKCPSYGASLSYYMVLSLAPLLVIMVAVIGFFSGQGAAHEQLVKEVSSLAGEKAAVLIDALLQATRRPAEGTTASLVALALLLVGATGVLIELRQALDHIWMSFPAASAQTSFYGTIRHVVWERVLALIILVLAGFLMVVSFLVSTYLSALGHWMQSYTGTIPYGARMVNFLLSSVVLVLLMFLLMSGLPSQRPSWKMVLPGAFVSMILFNIGKNLIGVYLAHTVTTSVYGAAGSLVALMIWVYYTSLIVLWGAEFAWVLHNTPKGKLPRGRAYRRMYHNALIVHHRQIHRQEEVARKTEIEQKDIGE